MEWCYRKLAKICGAPRQHLQMEIMRRGSCGEYSARQSAALQSAVQSRGPGREPPLILSSLLGPPSSLSLDPRRPGARSGAADWMPDDPGLLWWLGRSAWGRVHTHLLLDEAPPGAAASSLVTSKHNRIIHTFFLPVHLVLVQKGDFWTNLSPFFYTSNAD